MKYRIVNPSEYKSLAAIHKLAFKDFFLTSLGLGFLETYYKACLNYNGSIAVCAVDEEDVIKGFATGCLQAKGYHKKLFLNSLFSFALRGIILVFTKPAALFRLVKNLDKTPNPDDDRNYAELLAIAVLPELKGSGAGNELLKIFEKEALIGGGKRITLTTDYNNNDRVVAFYKKSSYRIYYDFVTYPNRKMYKLIKDLEKAENEKNF